MPKLVYEAIVPKNLNFKIDGIRKRVSGNKIQEAQVAFASAVIKKLQAYPPKRPESRYRRTGLLGRSWQIIGPRFENGNLIVGVGNNTGYSAQVEGFVSQDPKQMKTFAGWGWPSVELVRNEYYAVLRQAVLNNLQGRG